MSNPAEAANRRQRFVLRSDPPLKSYFVASLYTLSGAILLVLSMRGGWAFGFVVFGWVLIAFGALLALAALIIHGQLQTTLWVDADTLTLINPGRQRVLRWTDIEEVTQAGPRLIFIRRDAKRQVVFFHPRQVNRALFDEMITAVQHKLDASRGYGQLPLS